MKQPAAVKERQESVSTSSPQAIYYLYEGILKREAVLKNNPMSTSIGCLPSWITVTQISAIESTIVWRSASITITWRSRSPLLKWCKNRHCQFIVNCGFIPSLSPTGRQTNCHLPSAASLTKYIIQTEPILLSSSPQGQTPTSMPNCIPRHNGRLHIPHDCAIECAMMYRVVESIDEVRRMRRSTLIRTNGDE